jgi:hypothetical protein
MTEQAETLEQVETVEQAEALSSHQQAAELAEVAADALSGSAELGAEEPHRYELHAGNGRFLRMGRGFDEAVVRRLFHVICATPEQAELAQAELGAQSAEAMSAEAVSAEAVSAQAASAEAVGAGAEEA